MSWNEKSQRQITCCEQKMWRLSPSPLRVVHVYNVLSGIRLVRGKERVQLNYHWSVTYIHTFFPLSYVATQIVLYFFQIIYDLKPYKSCSNIYFFICHCFDNNLVRFRSTTTWIVADLRIEVGFNLDYIANWLLVGLGNHQCDVWEKNCVVVFF